MKPLVLFVDDEINILQGLRRMLRPKRHDWDMRFALGGEEGLEIVRNEPVAAVVSDMRMPGIDGAAFLGMVAQRQPDASRFILSGEADRNLILRTILHSHRFLTKPCDPDLLIQAIDEPLAMRPLFEEAKREGWFSRIDHLWSPPETLDALKILLNAPETTLQAVSELISCDAGLSARILQLANSAYFGAPVKTCSIPAAVRHLGLGTLRTIAQHGCLTAEGPSLGDSEATPFAPPPLACAARTAARDRTTNETFIETAFTTGLLWSLCENLPESAYRDGPGPRALAPAYLTSVTGLPNQVTAALRYLAKAEADIPTAAAADIIITCLADIISDEDEDEEAAA